MKVYRGLKDESLHRRPRVLAIGIFDGVHRGHQMILKKAVSAARKLKVPAMVVTFDPHPQKVLAPHLAAPKIVMSLAHRLRLFATLGITETLIIPFDRRLATLERETFLMRILIGHLGMTALSVGDDFRFGRGAKGDGAYLSQESKQKDFALYLSKPVRHARRVVSSTEVRRLIEKGRLSTAATLLGRPVSLYGDVVHGRGRGQKKVGFATANLNPHHETLPPPGVYAAYGFLNERRFKSVVHIGARPTFGDREKSVEAHFLNYHGSLYGREVELLFLGRLRGIRRFASQEALARQIRRDILQAEQLF